MAAKSKLVSQEGGTISDFGDQTGYMLESENGHGESTGGPGFHGDTEESAETDESVETDETDDTESFETLDEIFNHPCEPRIIQVSGGEENRLQEMKEIHPCWEIAANFNFQHVKGTQGLGNEGESMFGEVPPITTEVPQIRKVQLFTTRRFALAPSYSGQALKELQLVGRRTGQVHAERSDNVPKKTTSVHAADDNGGEESILEFGKPGKRPRGGSLVRRYTGFTIDVIER
ncbi:hypothetical protein JCM33374_g6523 [Metschnikowia sp. JCM 33374]|nr:hypothetical protein JCM33374_g6523 [Metschnikowia sp. JCM 33374]